LVIGWKRGRQADRGELEAAVVGGLGSGGAAGGAAAGKLELHALAGLDLPLGQGLDLGGLGGDGLLHEAAGLEANGAAGADFLNGLGAGILGAAGAALLDLKDAEVPELDPVALAQLLNNGVQRGLHHQLYRVARALGAIRDLPDKVPLGDRLHRSLRCNTDLSFGSANHILAGG